MYMLKRSNRVVTWVSTSVNWSVVISPHFLRFLSYYTLHLDSVMADILTQLQTCLDQVSRSRPTNIRPHLTQPPNNTARDPVLRNTGLPHNLPRQLTRNTTTKRPQRRPGTSQNLQKHNLPTNSRLSRRRHGRRRQRSTSITRPYTNTAARHDSRRLRARRPQSTTATRLAPHVCGSTARAGARSDH